MRIKDELLKLKQTDIYSLMLFALFKIKDIPEYSSLSELVYILDKESLLKLCEYFGGTTIKIPTIDELETVLYALILYQYVNIEKIEFNQALEIITEKTSEIRKVRDTYNELLVLLDKYTFNGREK